MSDADTTILGMNQQDLIRWVLILLIVVVAFGSLLDGGALSEEYRQTPLMIYIPAILLMYFVILTVMYGFGMQPSKFDLVFIPTLIIGMTILIMSFTNTIPTMDEANNSTASTVTTSEQDVLSTTPTSIDTSTIQNDTGMVNPGGGVNETLDSLLQNVLTALIIIFVLLLLGGLLYWFVNRKEFDPEIQLHKVTEYAKPVFESNRNIIEYYIEASRAIETLKGKAPDWYTPTFFSHHVDQSPGPPLSSYFNQLTELYKLARFAEREMTKDQVEEARELHNQVLMQVENLMEHISNMGGN